MICTAIYIYIYCMLYVYIYIYYVLYHIKYIYISNTLAGFWQIRISSKIRTGWQKWEGTSGAWGKIWPIGTIPFLVVPYPGNILSM